MRRIGEITEDAAPVEREFGVYISNIELTQSPYTNQYSSNFGNKIKIEFNLNQRDFAYVSILLREIQMTRSRLGLRLIK